ncbi:hypothetical protein WJX73_010813 [Symbiochloris irregularis]|uniref:Cytochrome P450 n=1 Tax=Symbiochloris irregularis TaxID=706552 RepID=A0AAW1PXU3_9CHLO
MDAQWLYSAVILVLEALAAVFVYTRNSGHRNGFVSPPGLFSIPFIFDDTAGIVKDFAGLVQERFKKLNASCIQLTIAGQKNYFIRGNKIVPRLLAAEHDIVEAYWPSTTESLLPRGVIAYHHEEHAAMRKLLNPAFSMKASISWLPKMVAIIEEHMQSWAQQGDIKFQKSCQHMTFEIVTNVMLDFPDSFLKEGRLEQFMDLYRTWEDGLFALPFRIPGLALDKALKARDALNKIIAANLPSLNPSSAAEREGSKVQRTALQEIYRAPADQPDSMEPDRQTGLALNLLFAGYDTSASTMCYTIQELQKNPQVMEALRKEQQQVRKEYGEEITADAVSASPYVNAVIRETLRTHLLVPMVPRRSLVDLNVDKYFIPKGKPIWLDIGTATKYDERWEGQEGTPLGLERYNPDRWLSEEGARMGNWLPFSGGPRICLGWQTAMLELKAWLMLLARKYSAHVADLDEKWVLSAFPVYNNGMETTFKAL